MSIGLTARELAQMQADIYDLLPDLCDILSVAYTSDSEGGFTEAWGTATADVKCRIDYRSGRESMTGGAIQPYSKAVLSVPYNTALSLTNRVKSGTYTWAIVSLNDGQSWQAVKRAELERVE